MTTETAGTPSRTTPRKRHWIRRVLITLAALIVLLVAGVVLYVKLAPVPAPLTLPATTSAPTGPVAGQWDVAAGSAAGFRIQQTVLFASNDVVQRTNSVSGTLTIEGDQVTAARFGVDLATLATDGKPTPQLALSLDTAHHPQGLVTLTGAPKFAPAFTAGEAVTETVAGQLSLRGEAHPVTITLTARRDGDTLRAAGTIPVAFAGWGIPSPTGYGPFGSLADHGIAEFSLVLRHH